MGFLSKLFGGDADTPSSQSEKPSGVRAEPEAVDEEATADLTALAAKRRASLKESELPPEARQPLVRRQQPVAPSLKLRQPLPKNEPQIKSKSPERPRATRRRSPGFYSVSSLPAVTEEDVAAEAAAEPIKITPAPLERAPAVSLEPVPNPEGQFSATSEQAEETNPGLGHTRSRHDTQQAVSLPLVEAELVAHFAVEVSLNLAVADWLSPVSAATEEMLALARSRSRDEWVQPLRQLDRLLADKPVGGEKWRQQILQSIADLGTIASLPFDVVAQKKAREGLVVEQLLATIPGVDSSAIQKIQARGLAQLEFWQNPERSRLSPLFSEVPEWVADAEVVFQQYTSRRAENWLAAVLLGKQAAIGKQLEALRQSAESFQAACDEDDSKKRRVTRRKRQEQASQVILLLAQFGEVDILREIEHSSVQIKIERLGQWLSDLKSGL